MLHVKGSDPTKNPQTIPSRTFARSPMPAARTTSPTGSAIFAAAADVDYYHWEYDLSPDPFASSKIAFKLMNCVTFGKVRDETGTVGGTVPATLVADARRARPRSARSSPGVDQGLHGVRPPPPSSRTAGDATLTVVRPRPPDQRRVLPRRAAARRVRQVRLDRPDHQRQRRRSRSSSSSRRTDPLRTGSYSKTVTFTLSTTQP